MKLKQSILFPFMSWMVNGGHSVSGSKGFVKLSRNGKVAKIEDAESDYLEINDYCAERYRIFLRQWLNHGYEFIDNAKLNGIAHIQKARHHNALLNIKG